MPEIQGNLEYVLCHRQRSTGQTTQVVLLSCVWETHFVASTGSTFFQIGNLDTPTIPDHSAHRSLYHGIDITGPHLHQRNWSQLRIQAVWPVCSTSRPVIRIIPERKTHGCATTRGKCVKFKSCTVLSSVLGHGWEIIQKWVEMEVYHWEYHRTKMDDVPLPCLMTGG